jgi:tungstate transport system ATP-binding protein
MKERSTATGARETAMAGNHLVVRFRNLQLHNAGRLLLKVPELDLWAGACQQITGNNGTGKSLLLKALAGLQPPARGEVQVDGPSAAWSQAQRWLRSATVYVHQLAYMFDSTVTGNVAFGLRRRGLGRIAAVLRASEALEWAGLGALGRRNALTLSPGEKQRVAIVRARVLQPRLLILDDPLSHLDEEAAEQTRFLLRRLVGENTGVVIAASSARPMQTLAHYAHVICNGTLQPSEPSVSVDGRERRPGSHRGERAR